MEKRRKLRVQLGKLDFIIAGYMLQVVQLWRQQINRPFRKGRYVAGRRWLVVVLCSMLIVLSACGSSRPRPTTAARITPRSGSVIPTSTPSAPRPSADTTEPTSTPRPAATEVPEPIIHIVEAGESLSVIAAQYDTTIDALVEANGITDPNRIAVGDELIIPAEGAEEGVPESDQNIVRTLMERPAQLEPAVVDRVVDGDTVDVWLNDGSLIRLRLIGIDTPETVDPNTPQECFGRQASDRAKELLIEGQTVYLEPDDSQGDTDRYDRYLRYVWLDDRTMFNYEMVATGYAIEYTYDLPYRYQAEFLEGQRTAAENGVGLWAVDTCDGNADLPLDEVTVTVIETTQNTPIPAPVVTNSPIPLPTNTTLPLITATSVIPLTATPLPLPTDTPVPLPTDTPLPPPPEPGTVVIAYIYYDGQEPRSEGDEYAEIHNSGGTSVNLAGWWLNADDAGQDFYFPAYELRPGESCRVYTNRHDPSTCGFSYGRGQAIWANDGECGHLYNASGVEVSSYCF